MNKLQELIFSSDAIKPNYKVKDLYNDFLLGKVKNSVAVVDNNNYPIGLIVKQKFLMKLSERYAYDLYYKKDVSTIMLEPPLLINYKENLNTAIEKALSRNSENVYDEIIVTDDQNKYVGLLSVKEMIIQQANNLANILVQKELAHAKAKELEEINKVKNHFLANVTHELRSPINIILGIINLIKNAYEHKEYEKIEMYINMIENSSNSLKIIVNNILDLSKIEAGKMEVIVEEFKLSELLTEIYEYAKILNKDKKLEIILDINNEDLIVKTDFVKLRQILINLISNAIKFTEKGYVKIEQKIHNDTLKIIVSDTGCGIKNEDLNKLFNAFTQLEDSKTKRFEGTGLGLTIVKKLTSLLGGSVSVESVVGSGSKFIIAMKQF